MIELCASTKFVKKKEDVLMKKIKSLLGSVLGYGFLFGIVLLIVFVLACFGGVIMHFFGFYYESVWKLMLFFILSGLVGLPLELVAKGSLYLNEDIAKKADTEILEIERNKKDESFRTDD